MKKYLLLIISLVWGLSDLPGEEERLFHPQWELFLKGSAQMETKSDERGGILSNRADLRLSPFGISPWNGFTLRAQVLDRRNLPVWDQGAEGWTAMKEGSFAPGTGLYYKPWGARFLWGSLDEQGLPARIRNVWGKSAPFAENHSPAVRDLKTEPMATVKKEFHLYLGSPRVDLSQFRWGTLPLIGKLPTLRGFAYGNLDEEMYYSGGAGLETLWHEKTWVNLEGFYSGRTGGARKLSSWFSTEPPLPERDTKLAAVNLSILHPLVSLSSDWAFSETFAYGRGTYANLGLTTNLKPWRISLAGDFATSRYVGRDGTAPGAGFRGAARVERKGIRSSLFRLSTTLRGPELGKELNRSSTSIYYRFPAPRVSKNDTPSGWALFKPRIARISLTLNRDARDLSLILDSYDALLALGFGPLGLTISGGITLKSTVDYQVQPFPVPVFSKGGEGTGVSGPYGGKAAGELTWNPWLLQFRAKTVCNIDKKGERLWDASLYASFHKKPIRLSLKVAAEKLPKTSVEDLKYTISWSLEKR